MSWRIVVAVELTEADALGVHLADELGISESTLARPVQAAVSSAGSFAVGAAGPLLAAALATGAARIATRRRASGLVAPPVSLTLLKIGASAAAAVALLLVCNSNRGAIVTIRGVPWVVLIVLGMLVAWTLLLGRTRFGRYVYAIGGNPEAARRAGVNLALIRTGAFALSGLTAGIAGIIYASRLRSVSTSIDGGTLVLYAVAAAVIGGTSLSEGTARRYMRCSAGSSSPRSTTGWDSWA